MRNKLTAFERFLVEWSVSLEEPSLISLSGDVNLEEWFTATDEYMYVLEQAVDTPPELDQLIKLWKDAKKEMGFG